MCGQGDDLSSVAPERKDFFLLHLDSTSVAGRTNEFIYFSCLNPGVWYLDPFTHQKKTFFPYSRTYSSVPFNAGSLGSQHRRQEDGGGADQLIVSLRGGERATNSADAPLTGIPLQRNVHALQEYLMVLAPQRLPYEIQMASGWDTGYPPEELVGLMQTSVGKGWHTPR